ncbi:putative drug exporter of the RND superfamily [Actinacidiphila yanglinensis]|uniref:Putative drug exporter of the RND superfamily n=1 Tax=Actinacidiphila yanglinensis TaxID=310779 RepID=A0A1H5WD08_9ACTN|nr:MMPL family transporter [Actinacidiphila yanglinensis]SEF96697.1 putative drug exporter of the RND superfamily [Actinacidiphila yanglinensis]
MAVLARWCLSRRLTVVLLWLTALVGLTVAASVAGSAYSQQYDAPNTESSHAATLLREAFPGQAGDSDTIVWHTDHGTVRAGDVEQTMTKVLDQARSLPGVTSVTSPYGSSGAGQISRDAHTAYAAVDYGKDADSISRAQAQALVDTAKAGQGPGLEVELGGQAIGNTEAASAHLSEVVGVAVAAVVLLIAFGSFAAMLLPIATALVGCGTAYMGTVLLGHAMTVADFAPMLGMLIGLGVGIDYALFIVTRHRKGLKRGLPVARAAEEAVATTGKAVVFAGGTVCVAVLGMLLLRLNFLNGVAVAASLTVLLTVAASVTLLPALLGLIGHRALSRRERRVLAHGGGCPAEQHRRAEEHTGCRGADAPAAPPTGVAARWSGFVARHPRLLGALAAAVMVVLALPAFSLHLGTSDQGLDPSTSTTRKAYDLIADGFGPGTNGPLTLVATTDSAGALVALDHLPQTLRHTPGVSSVTGPDLDGAGRVGVITVVPDSSPQSAATSHLVDELRHDVLPAAEKGTDLKVDVGGSTASYDDFAAVVIGKLPLFVGCVVGLGCLLLLVAFRSLGVPLKAAVMNIAAVASSFGVVTAIFQWGWGSEWLGLGRAGPIEPFLPVILVPVLFGLSMDYQVFLVSRMYEEWRRTGNNRRAVRVGLAETSRVINSAAVIMVAVFLAFVLSGDRVIAMFGIGLAAAVALDAFVLRTLLVPALMHLLGPANWWLPGWLERRLPRLDIETVPDTRPPVAAPTVPLPAGALAAPGEPRPAEPSGSRVTVKAHVP